MCVMPSISLLLDKKTRLRAIHEQSPKTNFLGYPDLRLKVREAEVIKGMKSSGGGKSPGEGAAELTRGGDVREGRVWQVRRGKEWEGERWVGGSITSCSQGDRRH